MSGVHNRRNVLAYLGLASAGVTVGTQDFVTPVRGSDLQVGTDFSHPRAVKTLRRLADAIERKDVSVESVTFFSRLAANDILSEEVTFKFVIMDVPIA